MFDSEKRKYRITFGAKHIPTLSFGLGYLGMVQHIKVITAWIWILSPVLQEVIQHGVLHLPKDRLKKFPELKFKYVEENEPEEFFIPYVWTLVYQKSGLYWNPKCICMFDPSQPDV